MAQTTTRRRSARQRNGLHAVQKKDIQPVQRRERSYIDFTLLLLIILRLAFGYVMLYSASSYVSNLKYGDSLYYLKRQVFATGVGVAGMVVTANIPHKFWKNMAPYIYVMSFALCCSLFVLGSEHKGQARWIEIGPINVQPSEIAKVAVILFTAAVISKAPRSMRKFSGIVKVLILLAPMVGVVAVTNLSTAIIILGIAVIMLFISSPQYRPFFLVGGGGAIALLVLVMFGGGYRAGRIDTWLHPTYQDAYQTLQGLYAIGSGGLFGRGLGESLQKGYVPEAQNDMIFSIICEELGLFGAICLILLFLVLIWRLVMIATYCKDMFGSFLVIGILAHISLQFILNIAVVTNSIPNTGVTLPFVSYGGTALSITLAEMGIALSVSRETESGLDGIEE